MRLEEPAFRDSAPCIAWLDLGTNRAYIWDGLPQSMRKAPAVQQEAGGVRQDVDLSKRFDDRLPA